MRSQDINMSLKRKIRQQLKKENQNHLIFEDIASQLGFSSQSILVSKYKSMRIYRYVGYIIGGIILSLWIGIVIQSNHIKSGEIYMPSKPNMDSFESSPSNDQKRYMEYYQEQVMKLKEKILSIEKDHWTSESVESLEKVRTYWYKEIELFKKEWMKCQNDERYTMPTDIYEAYVIGNYSNQLTELELFYLAKWVDEIPWTYHKKIKLDEQTYLYLYQLEVSTQNERRIQYYGKVIGQSLDQVRLIFQRDKERIEMSELVCNQLNIIPFQQEYAMVNVEILWYRGSEEKHYNWEVQEKE